MNSPNENNMTNKRLLPTHVVRKFVSGVGGTGKSYLINTIRLYVLRKLNMKVSIAAPTGIAAYNVNGLTIHRLLRLRIEDDDITTYQKLSSQTLHEAREELKDVVLLIVDEISMVSNIMLMFIHMRLSEIFDTNNEIDGWFGRLNILVLGDLLQLPPVREQSPFVDISQETAIKYFGIAHITNIWKELFTYDELLINMRQKDDPEFARILHAIRLGKLSEEAEETLRSHEIKIDYRTPSECLQKLIEFIKDLPLKTVCLLPTRKQCEAINTEMLECLPGPIHNLVALDAIEAKTEAQKQRYIKQLKKLTADSTRTGGLKTEISIKEGIKVMIIRNIDVTVGLVNGATGKIQKIVLDPFTAKPSKLIIEFEFGVREIERATNKFEIFKNVYVHRSQFPITLAHGITIHKSQGVSLESCVIDIGGSVFSEGQVYVALSRLTSIQGLKLINFNPKCIRAQECAILEYNRLRVQFRIDLDLLPQPQIIQNNQADKNIYIGNLVSIMPFEVETDKNINKKSIDIAAILANYKGFENAQITADYLNTTLQCLFNIPTIKRAIKMSSDSNLRKLILQYFDQMSNESVNTTEFSNQFRTNDCDERRDIKRFLISLFATYSHLKRFVFTRQYEECKCNTESCKYRLLEQIDRGIYDIHIPDKRDCKKALSFDSIFMANLNDFVDVAGSKCPECNNESLMKRTSIQEANQVIICALPVLNEKCEIKANLLLSNVPRSKIKIGSSKYELNSAAFLHGKKLQNGSYTALLRHENSWIAADNKNISLRTWPRNGKNAQILFYCKVDGSK